MPSVNDIQAVWAETFGCEVGPHTSFYALSGTSLMAMRIAGILSQRFDCDLDGADVLEAETPSALLEVVEELRAAEAG